MACWTIVDYFIHEIVLIIYPHYFNKLKFAVI